MALDYEALGTTLTIRCQADVQELPTQPVHHVLLALRPAPVNPNLVILAREEVSIAQALESKSFTHVSGLTLRGSRINKRLLDTLASVPHLKHITYLRLETPYEAADVRHMLHAWIHLRELDLVVSHTTARETLKEVGR